MAATYYTIEIWIIISMLYLTMTLTSSLTISRLENYMGRSRA